MEKAPLEEYFYGCLYFSVMRLQRGIQHLAEDVFKKLNIAPTYGFILMCVDENPNLCPTDVATTMNLEKSTVTRMVSKLVQDDLLTTEKEGRNLRLQLTEKGNLLISEIHECWKELYLRYSEVLGVQEANNLNQSVTDAAKQFLRGVKV